MKLQYYALLKDSELLAPPYPMTIESLADLARECGYKDATVLVMSRCSHHLKSKFIARLHADIRGPVMDLYKDMWSIDEGNGLIIHYTKHLPVHEDALLPLSTCVQLCTNTIIDHTPRREVWYNCDSYRPSIQGLPISVRPVGNIRKAGKFTSKIGGFVRVEKDISTELTMDMHLYEWSYKRIR